MIKDYFDHKGQEIADKMEHTPPRKLILLMLGVLSVGVFVLGYLQIKVRLESPFLADKLIEDKAKIRGPREFFDYFVSEQKNQSEITKLQQRDSDQDTLTDYQELYIYKTNAYNNDSDGDGVSDDAEINAGQDPACPSGQNCDSDGFVINNPVTATGTNLATFDPTNALLNTQGGLEQLKLLPGEERDSLKIYFAELEPSQIRELLKAQGAPADQVDSISDADLQSSISQILSSL